MDLETFMTTVYVLVDDWYKEQIADLKPKVGAPAHLSDSEVLTLALVGQWRVGVPWHSERGLVRYIHAHGLGMFPKMLGYSAFNQRVRYLFGVLVRLQQQVADWLGQVQALYECVDSLPLPAGSSGQYSREKGHWLWNSQIGKGPHAWLWGDRWLVSVTPTGAITGWLVGSADINDRWLMEGFLSARCGQPQLLQPPHNPRLPRRLVATPPVGFMGGWCACGSAAQRPYLADGNFNGKYWRRHWCDLYTADVITIPSNNSHHPFSPAWKRWLRHLRQPIETAFAFLDTVFDVKHLQAHSRWGQFTRLAAKSAAYNLGLSINQSLGRPLGALGTLIC
jgi:hypothetical protein